ncbi:glycoside hydrolase family 43 protein [Zopfia rhizophila CBS 207.26]|uniref:Glycoside hydrolase family 43 protein n=1 Tax=Zopfia rhizophila CBS 207.26 TaxID=1314779 RepID=A0A6A6DVK8_9PEZI|nr:glycoside hydrolase family 43 protein [Zopfia rhizophila CBS 207.26]
MVDSAPINPIIPGFAQDPSLVKVGSTYFLVNSAFHVFPGLPIYASSDLVSWKQIGSAIPRQTQLTLSKSSTRFSTNPSGEIMLATGGLFAPTIRYHKGTFYVVCTNIIHPENSKGIQKDFIISTQDIYSKFTGEKLSEERKIWDGTGGIYPEGPHIYKKDGWYYLMISEGCTHENHMITMARGKDIRGPYDACPRNPTLTARGTDEHIQYTGHYDAFQDGKEGWWGVCLGVRKDEGDRFIMGRETFLTSAKWKGGGEWLSFDSVTENPKGVIRQVESVALEAVPMVDFLYIRDADLSKYKFPEEGKAVIPTSSTTDLSHPEISPTFVGKRQQELNGRSTVTIRQASGHEHRYVRIFCDTSSPAMVFEFTKQCKEDIEVEAADSEDWVCLSSVGTLDMTGPDFVGLIIGIFVVAEAEEIEVDFGEFEIM